MAESVPIESPRSSVDRAVASEAMCADSISAEGILKASHLRGAFLLGKVGWETAVLLNNIFYL